MRFGAIRCDPSPWHLRPLSAIAVDCCRGVAMLESFGPPRCCSGGFRVISPADHAAITINVHNRLYKPLSVRLTQQRKSGVTHSREA